MRQERRPVWPGSQGMLATVTPTAAAPDDYFWSPAAKAELAPGIWERAREATKRGLTVRLATAHVRQFPHLPLQIVFLPEEHTAGIGCGNDIACWVAADSIDGAIRSAIRTLLKEGVTERR